MPGLWGPAPTCSVDAGGQPTRMGLTAQRGSKCRPELGPQIKHNRNQRDNIRTRHQPTLLASFPSTHCSSTSPPLMVMPLPACPARARKYGSNLSRRRASDLLEVVVPPCMEERAANASCDRLQVFIHSCNGADHQGYSPRTPRCRGCCRRSSAGRSPVCARAGGDSIWEGWIGRMVWKGRRRVG